MAKATSIEDQAAAGAVDEEDAQTEMFEMGKLEGDGTSLAKLVKNGKDNRLEVSISSARVPSGSGLADPESNRVLLVTCEPGKASVIPHKEEGRVVRYTTVQQYTPIYVENVLRGDEGRIEAMFTELLKANPTQAGACLDAMQKRAAEALG